MAANEQSNNQNVKFQYNSIYRDVKSIAEIYIDTIIEDILPFQYGKIMNALEFVIKFLKDNSTPFPADLDNDTKEQIIEIKNIPHKLPRSRELVNQALSEYLEEQSKFYTIKDSQICQIIAENNIYKRQEIINSFIDEKMHDKKQELISIITTNYDENNRLVNYKEDQATKEQKQAWLERDSYIQSHLLQRLEDWRAEEQVNYKKATQIYTNPRKAAEIIQQYKQQSATQLQEIQKSLSNDQYRLRAGQKVESIENNLLVKVGLLTKEEAALFNYEELNTYQAYYGYNEILIKKVFHVARRYYPESKNKGLSELAAVNHEKIPSIFQLIIPILSKKVSFKEIAEPSREEVDILSNNIELLGLLKPTDIINLHVAIANNNAKTLIDVLNNIEATNKGRILQWAAEKGNYEIVKLFLENGDDISTANKVMALHNSVSIGNSEIVKLFLKKLDHISATDKDMAFQLAVATGFDEIVKIIVETVNGILPKNKIRAILTAVEKGYDDIAKYLLENCDNEISDDNKSMILQEVIKYRRYDIVNFILEKLKKICLEALKERH